MLIPMCGFAGFLDISATTADRARVVEAMAATLVHRGPDDSGVWCDDAVSPSWT
jgi:asparagine synthase (glutamine-hydrolysing)